MAGHFTNTISRWFGAFADHAFSSSLQTLINRTYVNVMGLDMREFAPPETYPTLNKLFTRELRKERPVDRAPEAFISPVDALITECGALKEDQALQIKGMRYCVEALLTETYKEGAGRLRNGSYINFYLSPKDYHRYHVPCRMRVLSALHRPGALYPVNMPSLRKRKNLFVENERVILECRTDKGGTFFMVLVGALNVGKMTLRFDPRIHTNARAESPTFYRYDDKPVILEKGEELGMFKMGSTVLVFAEPGLLEVETARGRKVRFGERVGRLTER